MADNWQDATSQQIKLIADRLNELLSTGVNLLHSELGVDLGLKPELYPPWVILLAACIGLVLMVALWAWACRGVFKKRPTITAVADSVDESKAVFTKPMLRNEEPKRKKRKPVEKKPQPNGRAVGETKEEIKATEDVPHHAQTDVKPEKVSEVKKAKKKPKQAVKDVKGTADGKEPEEGTWETKVSNKEKREQRRKDKVPGDGSGSPGGGGSPPSITPPELTKAAAGAQKKKKGEVSRAKAEKDVVTAQVDSSDAGRTDLSVKAPAQVTGPDRVHFPANHSVAQGTPEPASRWGQETEGEGSWNVIDAGMCSGVGTAPVEPSPVTEVPWLGPPQVEDEWSGKNGESMDPSSDWAAPSEAWVNHEELPVVEDPPAVAPPAVAPPAQEEVPPEPAKVSDEEEKEKADATADGSGKSKKKKKKKKKPAEEGGGGADQDGEEPERETEAAVKKQPAQETGTSSQPASAVAPPAAVEVPQPPPAVIQVPQTPAEAEPSANQNNLPAPAQKKAEESQPSKPVKKKKARRET
ncbi:protein LYRIC-like isoform X3 [Osmerus eperlanus]|uniref:protein LYRIC-like isoform X3 n=1 Tax=Osmerus eperlanus TaxID=29151 RepID=UPI002E13AFA8